MVVAHDPGREIHRGKVWAICRDLEACQQQSEGQEVGT
jgi:hypothetical protein